MGELRVTHESTVTEDQIDHLGHMNVRFYAVNANAGTDAVLTDLPGWNGRPHVVHDLYTRHHREQLLGTRLVVRSAVVGVGADGRRRVLGVSCDPRKPKSTGEPSSTA